MRLVVDLQAMQGSNWQRGIGRYSYALTKALVRNRGEHEIFIALSGLIPNAIDGIRAAFHGLLSDENFVIWDAPGPVDALDADNDARRDAAELIRECALASLEPDYILVSSVFEGFGNSIITSIGRLTSIPTAAILYDLIPLIYRQLYLENPKYEKWYENKLGHVRNADLLLAISESSRREALEWLGSDENQVINISTAADDHFMPAPVDPERRARLRQEHGLDRPFVMYTGGMGPHKNIEGLIRAFARLPVEVRREHQLAIVCAVREADRGRLLKLAADEGLADGDLVLTGFISEDDLLACYRSCKLLSFRPGTRALACRRSRR